MRTKRRWMNWVLEEVETFHVVMPWDRSNRSRKWHKRISTETVQRLIANG